MKSKRRQHGSDFKARVALAAIKGDRTINEVASQYEVHPGMVISWKKQMLEELPGIFSGKTPRGEKAAQAEQASLYEQIGRLKVELEWLKKKMEPWT